MVAIEVTYRIGEEYVAETIENISKFLADFKNMRTTKFLYQVFLKEDGLTFVHLSMYENEEIRTEVLNTPSFVKFKELQETHGYIVEPTIQRMKHVGSSLSLIA